MKKLIIMLILILSVGDPALFAGSGGQGSGRASETTVAPVGGMAPISGGLTLMVFMSIAYGLKKHQTELTEEQD